ncbi:MAG TPA: right-handed parallel beta-helix repeat-containing protein [Candidatus Saccharimonadales bacterium]
MSRLPVPGSDNGTWGNVLNDFLSQAHNADGSLKPNAIPAGSITNLADAAINSPSSGQVLTYDASASKWKNILPATSFISSTDPTYGATGNGTTDDTAALNNLFAAAAAAGLPVLLEPVTHLVGGTASLRLPSGLIVRGFGDVSILKIASNPVVHPITNISGAGNIHLSDFKIDGNKAAIASATGASPDAAPASGQGNGEALYISASDASPASNATIDRITVINSFRLGIVLQSVSGGRVANCVVSGNNRDGITLYFNCTDIKILENSISYCGDDHIGLNAENGSSGGHIMKNISIRSNHILGPSPRNKGKGITGRGVSHLTISDNVVDSTCESAINLTNYNSSNLQDVTVSGNTIYNAGTGGASGKDGIVIQANNALYTAAGTRGTIQRVSVTGNVIEGCQANGIHIGSGPTGSTPSGFTGAVDGDVAYITVNGNTINSNANAGIWINDAPVNDVTISGNTIIGNTQSGIQALASGGPSPHKRLTITGNTCNGNGVNGTYLDTCAVIIVSGNTFANNTSNGLKLATLTLSAQISPNSFNGNGNPIQISGFSSTISAQQYTSGGVVYGKIGAALPPSAAGIAAALNAASFSGFVAGRTAIADASYSALGTDVVIAYTSLTAARTVTLPLASGVAAGSTLTIKDESGNAGTFNITVQRGGGSDTIDGATSKVINTAYGVLRIYCTGTGWAVV